MAEATRVEIGLGIGQVVSARLDEAALQGLRRALEEDSGGWHELESDDGTLVINLSTVVFLRVADRKHPIGFGGA
jgi:hypothetical protein